ncbi:unnamed protein product [Clonostachys solani]|uniref:Heterokaryon incompatibility domain-containing protein n=1 Tax=Clonostachys solani TaxID=160281 RepID=A0A9N9ZN58_9HYPO|nr:unnamed protein product [Clonostachys solani]
MSLRFDLETLPFPADVSVLKATSDPAFCPTCANLNTVSAFAMVPCTTIMMNLASSIRKVDRARRLLSGIESQSISATEKLVSWELQISLADLKNSSAAGCITCLLLKEVVTNVPNGHFDWDDPALYIVVVFCEKTVLRISVARDRDHYATDTWDFGMSYKLLIDEPDMEDYQVYTLPTSPCPWPALGCLMNVELPKSSNPTRLGGLAGHISSDPTSLVFIEKVRKWISNCKENHAICIDAEKPTCQPQLPERIISLGPESNMDIRLMEAYGLPQEPYIVLHDQQEERSFSSLSECQVLEEDSVELRYDTLPRDFQDAILVCRKLSIKYLWINALCKNHDDDDDWEIESEKKAMAYSNAELVLIFTELLEGNDGFLSSRKSPTIISGTWPDGRPFEIYARPWLFHDPDTMDWLTGKPTRYGSRTESFQEQLLPRRRLLFTKGEAIFDCLTSISCECGGFLDSDEDPCLPLRRILKTGAKYITETDGSWIYHEHWRNLVAKLSQLKTRNSPCELAAISHLASRWANGYTGRYLAGLWEHDLVNYLRWYPIDEVPGEEPEGCQVPSCLGPSWSWTATSRKITWGSATFQNTKAFITIDLSRTECDVSSVSPFGPATSGHIFLTGKILKVGVMDSRRLFKDGIDQHVGFRSQETPQGHLPLPQNVFCLRLCTKSYTANSFDDDCALILVPATADDLIGQRREVQVSRHVFKRFGLTNTYPHKAWNHEREASEVAMYLI